MKKFLGEFKDFINRGNVMDLAVAVIIGGAFTGICTLLLLRKMSPSVLNDIRMTDLEEHPKPNPREM